ncbi:hypothetical protein CHGG_06105 [Chaetomium globosum CBS 148.51]|uniref:Ferric oxidoreductase domain-containing protein n=1 Tax=Chaetomium globosum (strain ATCC 6205 / CBS 148.51 / DSM 1962 / NBRC 6347 / NRRL 1970) TaxID=306901 RepID=Q2H5G0_CHAGB|nr:uncharacterized protein CHGG_06105 [Chaetomium globosum CBS 148.51]EAQ89486.1 hypothetical protein CHGG_06105 [Chaetomium globosum CBS 148.51]
MATSDTSSTATSPTNAAVVTGPVVTTENSTFSRLGHALSLVQQIEALGEDPPASIVPEQWPVVTCKKGLKYVPENWLDKRQDRRSWVWKYGFCVALVVDPTVKMKAKSFHFVCKRCSATFNAQSTSAARSHLEEQHRIFDDKPHSNSNDPQATTSRKRAATNHSISEMLSRNKNKKSTAVVPRTQGERFRYLLVCWMATANIPFAAVENKYYRQILQLFNAPLTDALLPKGGDTTRSWLTSMYHDLLDSIKIKLKASPHQKHLSFDLWTSSHGLALLAVVVHYFESSGNYQTHLLTLSRITGTHAGENIAPGVLDVIKTFDLQPCLGYFQTDNADNNDTAMTKVLLHLNPTLSPAQAIALKCKVRVRCFGHILNLVAKAFLQATNKKLIKSLAPESLAHHNAAEEGRLLQEWRKSGPIGKLHFLVHHIRRSPQRRDLFSDIAKGKYARTASQHHDFHGGPWVGIRPPSPALGNSLNPGRMQSLSSDPDPDIEPPSQRVEPPSQRRSGRTIRPPAHLDDFEVDLPALGYRPSTTEPHPAPSPRPQQRVVQLGEVIDDEVDDTGYAFIQKSLKLAIEKLEKYLAIMDATPAYWAAMILLPNCKMRWIERFFTDDPLKSSDIQARFRVFFDHNYPRPAPDSSNGSRDRPSHRPAFGYDFYDPPDRVSVDEIARAGGTPGSGVTVGETFWGLSGTDQLLPGGPKAVSADDDDDLDWMNDPEKVEYIQQLLESLFEARYIVNCYNIAIAIVILVFTVWHWHATRSDNRKWQLLRQRSAADRADGAASPSAASSSSSTVAGAAIPPTDAKDIDIERVPLLARDRASRPRKGNQTSKAIKSWLAYQPQPLSIINRTLPCNGTSLFILAWLGLNVFFHFYRLPMRWDFFFIFADRTGCVFAVNLPLLYLLSAKNQPLCRLTGYSYEALNIFHRRVGELLCFEAAMHFVSMILWQFLLAREWLIASRSALTYFTHPIILCGIGALVSYEALYFTSLASFRQRWYELFLASHVVLQIAALAFLWFHYETSQPFVAASLLIFLADRLVWRLTLKRTTLTADLHILDNDTLTLSANWAIPHPPPQPWWPRVPWGHGSQQSILHGWRPTDHVFLTIPHLPSSNTLTWPHALQAHPFTIASAAPQTFPHPSPSSTNRPPRLANPPHPRPHRLHPRPAPPRPARQLPVPRGGAAGRAVWLAPRAGHAAGVGVRGAGGGGERDCGGVGVGLGAAF